MYRSILLLATFALSSAAVAQVPRPDEGAYAQADDAGMQAAVEASNAYYARIAPDIAGSGQPRDLAFAAILLKAATFVPPPPDGRDDGSPSQPAPGDPRIAQWQRLASARAGSDAVANAMLLGSEPDGDVRTQAVARWKAVEPDNLAPAVFAQAGGDDGTLLATAGQARRFDLHYYDQVRAMAKALVAHPPSEAERADMGDAGDLPGRQNAALAAVAMVAAVAMPSLGRIDQECPADSSRLSAAGLAACRQIGDVLSRASDTNLGTVLGLRLSERLAASSTEQRVATERKRGFDWRMVQWGELSQRQGDAGIPGFVRLLDDASIDSEPALVERQLREAGIPLEPPAGWQSPWQQR